MKRLKTTNRTIAEKCEIELSNNKIRLLGCEDLCKDIEKHFKFNPSFSCTCNNFSTEFGEGDFFYYELCHYQNDKVFYKELGLGNLVVSGNTYYIERINILAGIKEHANIPNPAPYYPKSIDGDSYTHVEAYRISGVAELFVDPHVIAYSNSDRVISPLYVEENSVVGRTAQGIQCLFEDDLISILSKFTKSIILKAHKLYVKTINCSSLVFSITKQTKKPPKGTLIWSEEDGLLKFFDGKTWKILIWKYDEDEDIDENT